MAKPQVKDTSSKYVPTEKALVVARPRGVALRYTNAHMAPIVPIQSLKYVQNRAIHLVSPGTTAGEGRSTAPSCNKRLKHSV